MANTHFYVPKLVDKKAWLDWRGRFSGGYGFRHNISLAAIRMVALHHSVTNPTRNAQSDVQTIYNIHVGGNKWGGIGYNFIITSEVVDGFAKVAYVGDLANARAHTPNTKGSFGIGAGYGNNHIIGICFIGSFHTGGLPSIEQLRSAHYLVKELIFHENGRLPAIADSWDRQCGHQECDPTQCPANQLAKLKQLVQTTTEPAPPPPPKPAPPAKPYDVVAITKKQVQLINKASVWNLDFRKWPDARAISELPKGTVVDVSQAADHILGSRFYLYQDGGINRADVKDYTPPPPPPPVTAPEDPQDQVTEEPPIRDEDGLTKDDLKGVNDTLARIEAIVTQILEWFKKIFR